MKFLFFTLLTVSNSYAFHSTQNDDIKTFHRIAVIGGGIGGTSSAYFLNEYLGDHATIDLYEPEKIGGRLATRDIAGREYEVGGSVIHPDNKYMLQFVESFGLKKRKSCSSTLGIFDGNEYVFVESEWQIVNIANLFWRYGLDFYKLQKLNTEMLQKFSRIYSLQVNGQSFKTVEELLRAMSDDFVDSSPESIYAFLKNSGLHNKIINEFVTAITRANYGQLTDIPAFVGSVAIAGAGADLWSVEGGNKRVAEKLLEKSRASLLYRRVTKISPMPKGTFRVFSVSEGNPFLQQEGADNSSPGGGDEVFQDYDAIIIATPMTPDKATLQLVNFTSPFRFPGKYQRIVCTMVQGEPKAVAFKLPNKLIDEILTTNASLLYNSVGRQDPVDTHPGDDCGHKIPPVYKIFSPKPLTNEQLDFLFVNRHETEVIDWLAYPHYSSEEKLGSFELLPGIYYNNIVEKAASAMEMSALAAKNIALLVQKFLRVENVQRHKAYDEL